MSKDIFTTVYVKRLAKHKKDLDHIESVPCMPQGGLIRHNHIRKIMNSIRELQETYEDYLKEKESRL